MQTEPFRHRSANRWLRVSLGLLLGAGEVIGEPLGPSSRRTGLVISEIMYHPPERQDRLKPSYIELHNTSPFPEDISGFSIRGSVTNLFPQGTILSGHAFLVVAKDTNALCSVYGLTNVVGPFTNSLPNDAGEVALFNRSGALLLSVRYKDDPPWPVAADGAGHSLVLARPSLGEGQAAAWASSARIGGSPGRPEPDEPDPLRSVVINEFRACSEAGAEDFIELYNHGNQALDLGGCALSDALGTNMPALKYVLPGGTVIPEQGYRVFFQSQFGFDLNSGSGRIFLVHSNRTCVLDAVRYKAQERGWSTGRFPEGVPDLRRFEQPTPGTRNQRPPPPEVVINEISYHPLSGAPEDEYIELLNRGSTKVELTGWRITGGVNYEWPCCDTLYPGDYRVLRWGRDLDSRLSDLGERLVLRRPVLTLETNTATGEVRTNRGENIVQEVDYRPGGRWGRWSAGGGATLELADAHSDARLEANWRDSAVAGSEGWDRIETTGTLSELIAPCDALQVMLQGEGEALLDDVEVLGADGLNRVANPDFENGSDGWLCRGTQAHSTWETAGGYESRAALHVRSSGGGDTRANHIRTRLTPPLAPHETVTIRARLRWLVGRSKILFRLKGSTLELNAELTFRDGGTPGARNSRAVTNLGPALIEVTHYPVAPAAGQPVVVTARADDPDGVSAAGVHFRVDPNATGWTVVPLRDDGIGGDAVANDGVFGATLPGHPAGTLVAFYLEASDEAAPPATSRFPDQAPQQECLIRWGDPGYDNPFGTYRIWMTQATRDRWAGREKLSNEPLDVTFVYGTNRVIYNAGALYTGSPTTSQSYDTPEGTLCGYDVWLPPDDTLFGATHLILDFPTSDPTAQRQQLMYWFLDQLDLPQHHRRYVNLFVNGVGQRERSGFGLHGTIYEDTQEPDLDSVLEWFPQSQGGHLYKADDWMETSEDGQIEASVLPTLQALGVPGTGESEARYRWNWRHRDVAGAGSSYAAFWELLEALTNAEPETLAWQATLIDVGNWMGTFAVNDLAANWDSFGNAGAKNTFLFKADALPTRYSLVSWDFDVGLGAGGATAAAPLFDAADPLVTQMFGPLAWQRAYWGALDEACRGFFREEVLRPWLEARHTALALVDATAPDELLAFVAQRRAFIEPYLAALNPPFAVTGFSFDQNYMILNGTAPLALAEMLVNSNRYPVSWTSLTNWQMEVVLEAGLNSLLLDAVDRRGDAAAGTTFRLDITYNGVIEAAATNLAITEVLNHPAHPDSEFVEIHNRSTTTLSDLGRYTLNGTISDPAVDNRLTAPEASFERGTLLKPGRSIVVPRNRAQFYAAFGAAAQVAGQLEGDFYDPETQQPAGVALYLSSGTVAFLLPRFPMPATAPGVALQLIDPEEPNWLPGNWAIDPATPATPGLRNSVAANLPPFPWLFIARVLPQNATGAVDGAGEREPWLLLVNVGTNAVDLSEFQLSLRGIPPEDWQLDRAFLEVRLASATPEVEQLWAFPPGSTIGSYGVVRLWLDGQPGQSSSNEWHTSFRAPPDHGRLVLARQVEGRSIYLDHFDYGILGAAPPDVPFNRHSIGWGFGAVGYQAQPLPPGPGYGGDLEFLGAQVFGSLSDVTWGHGPTWNLPWPPRPLPVVINEWMASNKRSSNPCTGSTDDWFELFNTSADETAYLEGCVLTDNLAVTNMFLIPQGFVIPPRGFLLVWADDQACQNVPGGTLHVSFKLDKAGDTIALLAPDLHVVDARQFTRQTQDISQGRWRDGAATLIFMTNATPGTRNYPDDWPPCEAPPPLHITLAPTAGPTLWFPAPDCPGKFAADCNDELGETDWRELPPGEFVWVVPTGPYLWRVTDPQLHSGRHRFYRVWLVPP